HFECCRHPGLQNQDQTNEYLKSVAQNFRTGLRAGFADMKEKIYLNQIRFLSETKVKFHFFRTFLPQKGSGRDVRGQYFLQLSNTQGISSSGNESMNFCKIHALSL